MSTQLWRRVPARIASGSQAGEVVVMQVGRDGPVGDARRRCRDSL
jgi:hypothetical protein